ncbi:oligo-1,6-glucosidase [Catalinimonas alkaloidigena]|uniref:Oligo-1,6-glucosidase n=1 Tax=Catalinimonas alkaloidigena TaxID=1075417 RepID=A0A1G9DBY1_9BACT|nr:alpha-glucosidase [Catalinimonas alkaloidigena]SDK61355.1 oligo-1,6-glucosidase [Catalinimonas alkaloidigena]
MASPTQPRHPAWWKESVIYQIYPRSFKDSNGDGIGDLRGILEKLDYLQDLGIDLIWLCPIYRSPNDDNGYDIADYEAIMEEFGTMDDFDALLAEAKRRNIGILMDLVVNHSSDEHRWFQEARRSKDNPYRDFYIWRTSHDGTVPNNWESLFGGSAWELTPETGEYYLHQFSIKQPDLNWEHEPLRQEVYRMMRFWLDKGIAGFRMDVIPLISKKVGLPNRPDDFHEGWLRWYANGPRLHEFLQEMHREVLQHYDICTVGEAPGVTSQEARLYVEEDRKELDMIFQFDHFNIDRQPGSMYDRRPWTLRAFKQIFRHWDEALAAQGWNSIYLGNHDLPRIVSRFGSDDPAYREVSAKMLATLLLTLRGTPYIYNGDEIGMTNVHFAAIDDYRDISARNMWQLRRAAGVPEADLLAALHDFSRDNARTPMQWDDSPHGGFSTAEATWIDVNPNYREINVAQAQANPDSVLNHYKKLIRLRRQHSVLVYGEYEIIDEENEQVYAYLRKDAQECLLIMLNFTPKELRFSLPESVQFTKSETLITNYQAVTLSERTVTLLPFAAVIFKLT